MEIKLADSVDKTLKVSENIFAAKFNEALVHQVVTAYLAGGRAGTKAQKTRSEVSGGGVKPWRQKGTGRARAGTIRSPLWRHGGKIFAAKPRNYTQKVNQKMYAAALRSIFSELLNQDRLVLVDQFKLDAPKTRELVAKLTELKLDHVLIISDEVQENLLLAARNLYKVHVCTDKQVSPASLIAFDKVLITAKALKNIEENLG